MGQFEVIPFVLLERDGLVLPGVSPEHEVGVSPGGLGGFHLESVVVVTLQGTEERKTSEKSAKIGR